MNESLIQFGESEKILVRTYHHDVFGNIRVAGTQSNPEFCAADVCRALGYTNGRKAVADHCDNRDVTKRDCLDGRYA